MKYNPLYETGSATGLYVMTGAVIEASSTSAAIAIAEQSAPAGCRTGVVPYRELSGLPEALPPAQGELGQMYAVVAQSSGMGSNFAPDGQQFGSFLSDAAGMCFSLEQYFGYRLGLVSVNAKPAPAATPAPAPAPSVTSSSAASSSAAPVTSGSAISSGGSVTSGG